MKKRNLIFCCAVFAMMLLSGCKLIYEKQIQGVWKLDTYLKNNVDDTEAFLFEKENYKITFYENKDFVEEYEYLTVLPVTNTGTWIIEKKTDGKVGELQLRLTDEDRVRIYDIKEISKETIDIYRADDGNGNSEELFLEPPLE